MKKFRFTALAVVGCFVFFLFGRTFFAQDKFYSGKSYSDKSYGVFIGMGKEEGMKLNNYEVLVIEPSEFDKDNIKKLHEKNKKIYAYLNIGSLENYRPYYEKFKDKVLGNYENWEDEYWMDVSNKEWQNLVVDELGKNISYKGFDGFFIDNCDVYYQFQDEKTFDGLCSILNGLRKYHLDTIINGGDTFVSKCIDDKMAKKMFDGINQECVFTSIDFENKKYGEKSAKDSEYFIQYLDKVKKDVMEVFLIEYGADDTLSKKIEKYCNDNGFYWYNARSMELK